MRNKNQLTRKQVAFDLDTHELEKYYPTEHWRNAYTVIKKHMWNNGFAWIQGSVYVSEEPMAARICSQIIKNLVKKNPWLNLCMRDCRMTYVGKEHNLNHHFDKAAKILTRDEQRANSFEDNFARAAQLAKEHNATIRVKVQTKAQPSKDEK